MKYLLLVLGMSVSGVSLSNGEDLYLKDGKILRSQTLRREGQFLFVKPASNETGSAETLVPLNTVDRIIFSEAPPLQDAKKFALAGNASAVLQRTESLLSNARPFADIPGNPWLEILRLHLAAVISTEKWSSFLELYKQWIPTGDEDIEFAAKLLDARASTADRKALDNSWRSIAKPGTPTLSAGLSWLELGTAALETQQWEQAVRAFLSVEVFVPHHRLLQPRALLGAIRAFAAMGDQKEAWTLVEELRSEYPESPQLAVALEFMGQSSAAPKNDSTEK